MRCTVAWAACRIALAHTPPKARAHGTRAHGQRLNAQLPPWQPSAFPNPPRERVSRLAARDIAASGTWCSLRFETKRVGVLYPETARSSMGAHVAAHTCPGLCRGDRGGRHARPTVRDRPAPRLRLDVRQELGHMRRGSKAPSAAATAFRNRRLNRPLPASCPGVDTAEGQRVMRRCGPVRRLRLPAGACLATPGPPPGGWSCDSRNLRRGRHRDGGRGAGGRVVQGAGGLRAVDRLGRPGAGGPDRRRRVQLLLPAGGVLQAVAQGPGAGARTRCVAARLLVTQGPKARLGPFPFLPFGGRTPHLRRRRPHSRCLCPERGAPKTRDTQQRAPTPLLRGWWLTPPTVLLPPAGRGLALALARISRAKLREMPEATGDIREIIGQVRARCSADSRVLAGHTPLTPPTPTPPHTRSPCFCRCTPCSWYTARSSA